MLAVKEYPDNVVKLRVKKVYQKSTTGYKSNGVRVPHKADAIPDEYLAVIKDYFLTNGKPKWRQRNWVLVLLGINIGNRCGDISRLHVGDVMWNGQMKSRVEYYAEKTRSWEVFYLQEALQNELAKYISTLANQSPAAWLFPSEHGKYEHLRTKSVWEIFHKAGKELDLPFHFSTHSLRKTLGRTAYKEYGVEGSRMLLRHKSEKSTLHYIGVTEDDVEEKAKGLPIKGINI